MSANDFEVGFNVGRRQERERIIRLLAEEAGEWLSHDGECDCRIKGLEVERLMDLIEGRGKPSPESVENLPEEEN